jgi:hypothetical protein
MTLTIKQKALEALREQRSILAHYPEERSAKGLVSFLSIYEIPGAEDKATESALRGVLKVIGEQLDGLRPWPVNMREVDKKVCADVCKVLDEVLN